MNKTPVDHFYDSRRKFTIIGLTGMAGSGCTSLANIMSDKTFFEKDNVRKPSDIPFSCTTHTCNAFQEEERANIEAISKYVFKRKYTICYNFAKNNYAEYKIIKYTHIVLLYIFLKAKETTETSDEFKEKIKTCITDKFFPSHHSDRDKDFKKEMNYQDITIDIEDVLNNEDLDWQKLYDSIKDITFPNKEKKGETSLPERRKKLAELFFDNPDFKKFIEKLITLLSKKDYYSLCFMFHRLSEVIRNWGDPFRISKGEEGKNFNEVNEEYDHLFDLVSLINDIIKGERHRKEDAEVRIVIDSIRNSLEGLWLKERYSAFYLIAVHNDERRENFLLEKVKKTIADRKKGQKEEARKINLMHKAILHLANVECDNKDFENGKFFSPNVGQCIADAEIHISNSKDLDPCAKDFHTMSEQWLKFSSLIRHPGLITPSSEERCMIVAYTAKFNSGCLSRQVGACITNQYHTIRTIGWNDVPYGQIPCSLRQLSDLKRNDIKENKGIRFAYSAFEKGDGFAYDKGKQNFTLAVDSDYTQTDLLEKQGLPWSFCFKTLHNRYEGEKNQVFTRSLHAEENAMLQMVKYGGEALINGIIYVTASPCELCAKKLYQIGVRKIVYIDPYPGISRKQIIDSGFKRPELKLFQGAYGGSYFKLYQPFMNYKDEISIRTKEIHNGYITQSQLLKEVSSLLSEDLSQSFYDEKQKNEIIKNIKGRLKDKA